MAFIDHHDVFVGSTDDGHTFIVLNRRIRTAHRALIVHGFTAREHQGRTLYLLPPDTSPEEAHHRTGDALHHLLTHTTDFVDLSWTTRFLGTGPLPKAVVRFDLSHRHVTALAHSEAAHTVLEQHGFVPAPEGYALPTELSERESVSAVARAEAHLWSLGLGSEIALGLPTPQAINAAPDRTGTTMSAPQPQAPRQKRNTR
ncbi:hypothetical protein [Streptomyces albireticuli]|uniref:Uncharacterized protein n=1 Tax=Streptomyces albireticuli TaxID=1940 RepID=A0A2A2D995_9ACTN|nr:hypothetical protein [Streptomyces albireticuli]MCD9193429.1 hypothetical protein [Streptomyces albireticuli]PAU47882.1 hypothetical protein CK936_16375 [Streptomyces albireticuli]